MSTKAQYEQIVDRLQIHMLAPMGNLEMYKAGHTIFRKGFVDLLRAAVTKRAGLENQEDKERTEDDLDQYVAAMMVAIEFTYVVFAREAGAAEQPPSGILSTLDALRHLNLTYYDQMDAKMKGAGEAIRASYFEHTRNAFGLDFEEWACIVDVFTEPFCFGEYWQDNINQQVAEPPPAVE